ncbi:DUF2057 family protein [Thiohalophilus thiocyanatoxydans]|uniref:Uncharacterized protein YccT (UPF0319 family) n=1 Tax=Thiohalophilus thiocyanatoxydans TaxID=381308 RepID=A0A4R8IT25_9GAMM|nr:DUF2057 family protein [Thiohalophilus thiocyanatoxydans]TDY04136.1 uncharacterized protein YccT (UPF0319 family) [Thiohalophilus thiocyanatoxydans]
MNWRTLLSLGLASLLLSACAPSGPVKFYSGPEKSPGEIARVKVPGPITVTAIDDSKISAPSQDEGFYELHLPPGRHTLTLKYELYWGSGSDGMLVKSSPTDIRAEFSAGRVYELRYAEPGDEDEAFSLANDFQATLVETGSGTRIAATASEEYPSGLTNAEPVVRDAPTATPAPADGSLPSADQAANEDAVKRLKFWWLMADEKEREAFRKWMQQDMPNFNE